MATLKVLGAGPVKRGVTQLAEKFEKTSGHRVSVEFAGAPSVRERVLAGEAVDVAIVPQATMDEFAQQGSIVTGTRGLVGRSRMGIVVRKGAPLPDAIQNVTAYGAAVAGASASKDAAAELAGFLIGSEAKAVFAATGID